MPERSPAWRRRRTLRYGPHHPVPRAPARRRPPQPVTWPTQWARFPTPARRPGTGAHPAP
ncbi:hypothetical protein ACFFX0_14040 [Citricoccus parietis]|uniref:Uncharacterized protein n=1 Tax=Citricoccus parietis TaxID=592307 RepID=A0ABV5FZZ5_9MICC